MSDLVYLVLTLAFFAACVGLVRVCDALIGPDDDLIASGERDGVGSTDPTGGRG